MTTFYFQINIRNNLFGTNAAPRDWYQEKAIAPYYFFRVQIWFKPFYFIWKLQLVEFGLIT